MTAVSLGIPGIGLAERIGSGGFATVYRARESAFDRWVAVKVIHDTRPDVRARFGRELKAVGRLSDVDGIVTAFYTGQTPEDEPFLVMPLLRESLQDLLDRDGPLAAAAAATTFTDVGAALQIAHDRGIVHRDLKPANVMLNESGRALLADFGIARIVDVTSGYTGNIGTVHFMAPELFDGSEPMPTSDVYALGATLLAALTGEPPPLAVKGPWSAPPAGHDYPDQILEALHGSLSHEWEARITAGEFAEILSACVVPPPPMSPSTPRSRPAPPQDSGPTGLTLHPDAVEPASTLPDSAAGRGVPPSSAPTVVRAGTPSPPAPPSRVPPAATPGKNSLIAPVLLVVLAVVVIGVIVLLVARAEDQDESSANSLEVGANSLEVGACTNDELNRSVGGVATVDCADSHTAEVFAIFDLSGEDFPGVNHVQTQATNGCNGERFEEYVGTPYEESEIYATYLLPTKESWEDADDRTIICLAVTQDGSAREGSVENANR